MPPADGSTSGQPTNLGDITVDAQGIHATGSDAIHQIYQPLVIATRRESIFAEARALIQGRSGSN